MPLFLPMRCWHTNCDTVCTNKKATLCFIDCSRTIVMSLVSINNVCRPECFVCHMYCSLSLIPRLSPRSDPFLFFVRVRAEPGNEATPFSVRWSYCNIVNPVVFLLYAMFPTCYVRKLNLCTINIIMFSLAYTVSLPFDLLILLVSLCPCC